MRLLARPPAIELDSSFRDAYAAGRFTQLDLITHSELETEAKKQGLAISDELLELLDREGVFKPVAFASAATQGRVGSRWRIEELSFRDELPYRAWSHYGARRRRRSNGFALYSAWQLMYLKSALEEREWTISVSVLLSRRERLWEALKRHRRYVRSLRPIICSLEDHWRPVILLLCWLQDRYLPLVLGRTSLVFDSVSRDFVDPFPEERSSFDPSALLAKLGLAQHDVLRTYEQLALIGQTRDPIEDWYLVVRAAPHQAHEKFEGDARLAHLIYDAAEVLRRFLTDLTGDIPADCHNLFASPTDWTERWLGHERRVFYDREDFKKILESRKLTPHGVHVFVEGSSDIELIGGLIDELWGDHRAIGVRFTSLDGLGNASRQRTLFDAFSTYARKAVLVADNEGKIQRDRERLRESGFIIEDDEFHAWERNIEEDSATLAELLSMAAGIAAAKGGELNLDEAKLRRIMAAGGGKKGAAEEIINFANQRGIHISKRELVQTLRGLISTELSTCADQAAVTRLAERRAVLQLAINLGRYSASS